MYHSCFDKCPVFEISYLPYSCSFILLSITSLTHGSKVLVTCSSNPFASRMVNNPKKFGHSEYNRIQGALRTLGVRLSEHM